ncbi:N-acetylglutamate synthase, GNAT family [Pseudarcicella hirudinis]|uniref:N-acetylglutamate synthase, GNAT family n=1 Tax=Pseudarcicella hirudinis TaxID=1079859 RepID=A0A1I5W823_9BACT|nr:GNAT family N-acetyltransferase [Pseudarcicella hirudinis]SFQ15900.1 N-acetylglutamate synthase, GNAT family [Pseudarcicella hirudinis]
MISIRKGTRADVPATFELIKELAVYEKALHEVTNSVEQMYIDGFGEKPIFDFFVAEVNGEIVGTAIYYFRYSTWKGKRLYLEDLVVKESMRGQGLGEKLLEAIIQEARDTQSTGVMWQVLDWNEPAINFYKKFGAQFDGEWINVHVHF